MDELDKEFVKLSEIGDLLLRNIRDELKKEETNYDGVELMMTLLGTINSYKHSISQAKSKWRTMRKIK